MTKRAETTIEPIREASDVFDGVGLQAPLLQLAQKILGPFLAHRGECAEECTCGLRAAVEELRHRELMVQRYGVIE